MATNNALNNMLGTTTSTTRVNSSVYNLTAGSSQFQSFSGFATGDSVTLPVASTLMLGRSFTITTSGGTSLPVNSSGSNLVLTLGGNGDNVTFTCILTSGTTAASWSYTIDSLSQVSWSPVATFTTPGNLSVSYSAQSGSYTVSGKFCWINLDLRFTPTYTTASGSLQVTGFPLTTINTSNPGFGGILVQNGFPGGVVAAFPYPTSTTFIVPQMPAGGTTIQLAAMGSGVDIAILGTTQFPSGTARYFRIQMLVMLP